MTDREMMTYDERIARLENQLCESLQLLERTAGNLQDQAQVLNNVTRRYLNLVRRIEDLESKVHDLIQAGR